MKPDLSTECMHSNKRRAIQHKDAKCPFTAPIEAQHPPPGAMQGMAVPWPRARSSFPDSTLEGLRCTNLYWDLGNRGALPGVGSRFCGQAVHWCYLCLYGKTRWHWDSGHQSCSVLWLFRSWFAEESSTLQAVMHLCYTLGALTNCWLLTSHSLVQLQWQCGWYD